MNQFRKGTRLALVLTICGLLLSCAEPADNAAKSTREKSENQKPKIALIMKSLANDFFSTMAKGAETHQQEHGDEYELVVNGIKDERDLSRQVALVETQFTI